MSQYATGVVIQEEAGTSLAIPIIEHAAFDAQLLRIYQNPLRFRILAPAERPNNLKACIGGSPWHHLDVPGLLLGTTYLQMLWFSADHRVRNS
jgi:hypothetical protein